MDDVADTPQPVAILMSYGVNDIDAIGIGQAEFESNYGYALDQFHAKWPDSKIYLMRVWWSTTPESTAIMNDLNDIWIPNIISTRSAFCFLGPDERVFLENGDDGATYTTDGTHPNAAGYDITAAQWAGVL